MKVVLGIDALERLCTVPVSRPLIWFWACLLRSADPDGYVRLDRDAMATRAGIHREMVSRYVTSLEKAGLVSRVTHPPAKLVVSLAHCVA